jgi:hypothetical protein
VNRVRTLLVGVFTDNLRTKAMALVVSIVVFVFVQGTLRDTETIRDLKLVFELAPELEESHVLVGSPIYVLPEVSIEGEKVVLENLRRQLEREANQIRLTVDRRFLDGLGSRPYKLDRTFLKDRNIPAANVEVTKEIPGAPLQLQIDDKVPVVGLRLVPSAEMDLSLAADNPYEAPEGDKVNPRFFPETVTLAVPNRALLRGPQGYDRLFVAWEVPLDRWLKGRLPEDPFSYGGRLTVNWQESGLDPALDAHFEVDGRPATDFRPTFSFEARARGEEQDIAIDVVVRDWPNPKEKIDLKEYRVAQVAGIVGTLNDKSIANNRCERLVVRMQTARVREKDKLAERLVLVVDLSRAERAGNNLEARLFLDAKDRASRSLLDSITIHSDTRDPKGPYIRFTRAG